MSKLIWKPVFHNAEIASLGRNSSFYLLEGEHLSFLFLHEANEAIVLIISLDEFGLTIYHVLEVQCDNFISKIIGNSDLILMLDVNGDLFYLRGTVDNNEITFNFTNVISFLSKDVILKWCRLFNLSNCLAVEDTSEGAGFIYHDNECVYFTVYTTTDVTKGLSKLTTKMLNYLDMNKNYFMVKITGENAKIISEKIFKVFDRDELLLISEPKQLRFAKLENGKQTFSKPIPVDFETESIFSIINFNKKGCIFIMCKSGKIICLKVKTIFRNFELCHLFLGRKIYSVTGYEDDGIKLFWSDHKYVYMSTITDNFESAKLQVIYKLGGVLHIVVSNNNFLMLITRNACLYETRTNLVKSEKVVTLNSRFGLLKRMHQAVETLQKLTEKVNVQEYFMEALKISNLPNKSNNLYIIVNKDSIILENYTKCVFLKNFWRVQIEMDDFQRKHLEMRDLHNDIEPKGSATFDWNGKNSFSLKVTLFCDVFFPKGIIAIEVIARKEGNASFAEDKDLFVFSQNVLLLPLHLLKIPEDQCPECSKISLTPRRGKAMEKIRTIKRISLSWKSEQTKVHFCDHEIMCKSV